MLSLTTFADELEREKARQRTYDALERKARAGHVTGGACFGYRNVEVVGADGRRSHVTQEVDSAEAAIVRQVFELCANGLGQKAIAKQLNMEGAQAPRAQQGRPRAMRLSGRRPIRCTAPGSLDTHLCYAAWRSTYSSRASIGV